MSLRVGSKISRAGTNNKLFDKTQAKEAEKKLFAKFNVHPLVKTKLKFFGG